MIDIRLIICVFLCSFSLCVFANENAKSDLAFKEAIQIVVNGKGDLTKSEYDAFWKLLPVKTLKEKENLIQFIKENYVDLMLYQKNVWACAKEAWLLEKVPVCELIEEYEQNILGNLKQANLDTKSFDVASENARRLISSSAKHTSFQSVQGEKVNLSLQLINETHSSLTDAFNRLAQALK